MIHQSYSEYIMRSVLQIILIGLITRSASCYLFDLSNYQDNCKIEQAYSKTTLKCIYNSICTIVQIATNYYNETFSTFTLGVLEVECRTTQRFSDPAVYDILHNLNLTRTEKIKFINCALPVNSSVGQGFPHLSELTIQSDNSNVIGPFQKVHFSALSIITNLTVMMQHNTSNELANDVFDEMLNLKSVTIGYNIKNFETKVFAKHDKLQSLRLSGNQFERLTKRSLSGVSQLNEIVLVNNYIKAIDSDAFEHMLNLDAVYMHSNRIESMPKKLSGNFRIFQMTCHNIEILPDELFSNLPRLTNFSLNCNRTSVPENMFSGSVNIDVIDLSFNELTTLPLNLFKNLYKLTSVFLHHNLFTTLPYDLLLNNKYLLELNLSNNRIKTVNFSFLLKSVNIIDFLFNLRNFYKKIKIEGIIKKINLSHNSITEVEFNEHKDTLNMNNLFLPILRIKLELALAGNPFNCSCEKIYPMIMYNFLPRIIGEIKCVTPSYMVDRDVRSIQRSDLICSYLPPKECQISTYDANERIMIMNCSNAKLTRVPELPKSTDFNFYTLELYLDHNAITEFPKLNTEDFSHITKIIARNNSMKQLLPENIPTRLAVLDVSNNHLRNISRTTATILSTLQNISFGGNLWNCGCNESDLVILQSIGRINDWNDIKCENGQLAMEYIGRCTENLQQSTITTSTAFSLFVASVLITLLISTIVYVLYYRNEETIYVWLYAHNVCMCVISEDDLDHDKQYDAFLSIARQDDDFVANHLLPELEDGPNPFRICFHARDWIPGDFIFTQVMESVENSCRTIIVLSPNYLQSIWGKMEFRVAYTKAMKDGRPRLIVILYKDVGDINGLDPEIKAYLKSYTYLKWGDPQFFDKLRYALPHRRRLKLRSYERQQRRRVQHNQLALNEMQQNLPICSDHITNEAADAAT